MINTGYIQLNKSADVLELISLDPKAFLLLTVIALRAKRTSAGRFVKLSTGEALIGDYKMAGLKTESEYREAKKRLAKYNLCTFRTTNRGTVAKLTDTTVYNINAEGAQQSAQQANNDQTTTKPQADSGQTTTNNKGKKGKNGKNDNNNKPLYADVALVMDYLNQLTGRTGNNAYDVNGKEAREKIGARLKDGHTVEDCMQVINTKTAEWLNDAKMKNYLRVKTLFAPTNFVEYLAQIPPKVSDEKINTQNISYD